VRRYVSQGQHKTLLIALKLAEFLYLQDVTGEKPLVLLDDVFGELDSMRSRRILNSLERLGQTFITATDSLQLDELTSAKSDWREVHLGHESVQHAEAEA